MKAYVRDCYLQATKNIPAQGTIGQPLTSTFDLNILAYNWDVISLFRTMEVDPDVVAQNMLVPVEVEGALYDAFKSVDSTEYNATPIWFNGASGVEVNREVATAKRRYKLQSPNAANLYMEAEVGILGVGSSANAYGTTCRPYVKVVFASDEAFTSIIGEHNFAVKTATQGSTSAGGNYAGNVRLRYIVHSGVLAIYPHALPVYLESANALGKRAGYSAPYKIPVGLVIASGDYYAPLSSVGKTIFVLCSPYYERTSDVTETTTNALVQFGFSAAKCKGAPIFTAANKEVRGFFSPSISGGAISSNNPARNYIAPFTHVFGNGTILTCPDLVYVSDPDRSKVDFATSNLLYNGESADFAILPMMMSHPITDNDWMAPSFSYQLGIKV